MVNNKPITFTEVDRQYQALFGAAPKGGDDQVTTTIYTYERPGGIESVDRTMALQLRRGGGSGEASRARGYPTLDAGNAAVPNSLRLAMTRAWEEAGLS